MVADGCLHFTALAVVADSVGITPPCGACRQVMAEFCAEENTPVIMSNGEKIVEETVKDLLPYTFISLEMNETK